MIEQTRPLVVVERTASTVWHEAVEKIEEKKKKKRCPKIKLLSHGSWFVVWKESKKWVLSL